MRRRFRQPASGPVPGGVISPLSRMLMLLIVLGLIYSWSKKPESWRWLDHEQADSSMAAAVGEEIPEKGAAAKSELSPADREPEKIVPAATDLDKSERDDATHLFEAVTDRAPLAPVEMSAYWRLMKWVRAQSFADLERRAQKDVAYTRLWEQPDKYRGTLLRLRLHIKRVLDYDAPENSAGVKRVYEAWGWTDESKSYPYVVVVSELPRGMKVGADVQDEGVFVGYFLKTMSFKAFNAARSAPLLVGRLKPAAPATARPAVGRDEWFWLWAIGIPIVLIGISGIWLQFVRARRVQRPVIAPTAEAEMEDWFRNGAASPSDKLP